MVLVSKESAPEIERTIPNTVLEVARPFSILWHTVQHACDGSGAGQSDTRLEILAESAESEKRHQLGRVSCVIGKDPTSKTQDRPQCLKCLRVAKLYVRVVLTTLVTEEPYVRIGHVRICGGLVG